MRAYVAVLAAGFLLGGSGSSDPGLFAQAPVLTIEPKCPVSASAIADENTREVRVTYFPQAPGATIKSPQKLTLDVGINGQFWPNNTRAVPFIRKEDGTWQATLTRNDKDFWTYLMFQVKDEAPDQVDDNGRKYWDVVTCYTSGELNFNGLDDQAHSYTGYRFDNGMGRPQDYGKAVALLDDFMKTIRVDRYSLLREYWDYKVKQDGDDDAAWQKVSVEIRRFIGDHRLELEALGGASNFVTFNEKHLPPDLYPTLMHAIETLDPERAATIDRIAGLNRIRHEKGTRKRADDLAEFIRKYPNDRETPTAAAERLSLLRNLHEVDAAAALFPQLVQFDPGRADTYAAMAAIYIENGQKIDEALKLLDRAEQLGKSGVEPGAARIPYYLVLTPDPAQSAGTFAYWRARAYLQQNKGDLALPLAQKALDQRKTAGNYFLLAHAYESVGEKQKAVDAYLEAMAKPSEDTVKERERLEQLWVTGGFGTKEQLDLKLQAQHDQFFGKSNYVPRLVDISPNQYEFTTTKGETLRSADLRDKTVVLNFWATWCGPCVPELPGFQDLQRKHPELIVATLAIASEREQIDRLVQDKKLNSLRVAQVPNSFSDAFVPQGVPVTYVIDHDRVRVIHREPLSDVVAYIEADLAAIQKEPARKN
jgi:thiol-disulfide isomerase/thioredoxin